MLSLNRFSSIPLTIVLSSTLIFQKYSTEDFILSPLRGNVIFASGMFGFCFSLESFAKKYCSLYGTVSLISNGHAFLSYSVFPLSHLSLYLIFSLFLFFSSSVSLSFSPSHAPLPLPLPNNAVFIFTLQAVALIRSSWQRDCGVICTCILKCVHLRRKIRAA